MGYDRHRTVSSTVLRRYCLKGVAKVHVGEGELARRFHYRGMSAII